MSNAFKLPHELRFMLYVIGLYVAFIKWGILQEKLTKTEYDTIINGQTISWDYPIVLNLLMAFSAHICAAYLDSYSKSDIIDNTYNINNNNNINNTNTLLSSTVLTKIKAPLRVYWKAALTCCVASPLGYASLKFISFPMMILVKSSKPIPIMLIGLTLYKQTYPLWKYISVLLLTLGISMFSYFKYTKINDNDSNNNILLDNTIDYHIYNGYQICPTNYNNETCFIIKNTLENLFGFLLVGANLGFDGFTNNEQDSLFNLYRISSYDMMKNVNAWQTMYLSMYLFIGYIIYNKESELMKAYDTMSLSPNLTLDIGTFCLCASVGQALIFNVIKEFGSLTWVTISITRKLFTILFSVFIYKHIITLPQWLGVIIVFAALVLEVVMKYSNKVIPKSKISDGNKSSSSSTSGSREEEKYEYKSSSFSTKKIQ